MLYRLTDFSVKYGFCSFCLDTKRTKKVKADENCLKLSSLYRKTTRPDFIGTQTNFPAFILLDNFLTPIFIGRSIFVFIKSNFSEY